MSAWAIDVDMNNVNFHMRETRAVISLAFMRVRIGVETAYYTLNFFNMSIDWTSNLQQPDSDVSTNVSSKLCFQVCIWSYELSTLQSLRTSRVWLFL